MKNISKAVEKIKTHILYKITIFRKSSFYEMVWKNVVEPDRPQIAMLYGACAWSAGYIMLCFEPLISLLSSFMSVI